MPLQSGLHGVGRTVRGPRGVELGARLKLRHGGTL